MSRVIAYIDGFNLYFGLRNKGWKRYYWLNLEELIKNLLKSDQKIQIIKYFTARITGPDIGKRKRQNAYLEALETLPNLKIFYGHYLEKIVTCYKCNNQWKSYEEKMTDVRISTEILFDAFNNMFDTALLISGDSDLVPPVVEIRRQFPQKRIVVAFPPDRVSLHLTKSANAYFTIGEAHFRNSMFTDQVAKPDGYTLIRPQKWQKNVKP